MVLMFLLINQTVIKKKKKKNLIGHTNGKWPSMTFNPDHSKKSKEVILSKKADKAGVAVVRTQCQEHRGLYLDEN